MQRHHSRDNCRNLAACQMYSRYRRRQNQSPAAGMLVGDQSGKTGRGIEAGGMGSKVKSAAANPLPNRGLRSRQMTPAPRTADSGEELENRRDERSYEEEVGADAGRPTRWSVGLLGESRTLRTGPQPGSPRCTSSSHLHESAAQVPMSGCEAPATAKPTARPARTTSGAARLSAYGAARAVRPNGVVHANHASMHAVGEHPHREPDAEQPHGDADGG